MHAGRAGYIDRGGHAAEVASAAPAGQQPCYQVCHKDLSLHSMQGASAQKECAAAQCNAPTPTISHWLL